MKFIIFYGLLLCTVYADDDLVPLPDPYQAALISFRNGDVVTTETNLDKAKASSPSSDVYALLALTAISDGNFTKADSDLSTATKLDINGTNLSLTFIQIALNIAKFPSADKVKGPQDLQAINDLADHYNRLAANDDAHVPYVEFYRWYSQRLLGFQPTADLTLKTYVGSAPNLVSWDWPNHISLFLLGKESESALMEAAKTLNYENKDTQVCEAYFYIGAKYMAEGNPNLARASFLDAIKTNQKTSLEWAMANAFCH